MASIDEAYLDLTGTERLLGPPLAAAHALHNAVQGATKLNCSIGAASSRLVAKIASDQAKPHGILWIPREMRRVFSRRWMSARFRGWAKSRSGICTTCGIRKIGDLARLEQSFLEERFGKWGLALAGKARGEDAGGVVRWRDWGGRRSQIHQPRTHVFGGHGGCYGARRDAGAALGDGLAKAARSSFARAYGAGETALYGFLYVHAGADAGSRYADRYRIRRRRCVICFARTGRASPYGCWAFTRNRSKAARGRPVCSTEAKTERWRKTLEAVDKLREKYGDTTVSLAAGLKAAFRARVHENPENLPGKDPRRKESEHD